MKDKKPRLLNTSISITYSLTTFLGAFLLFQIQPMISKYILPWFGGSSAVWITALLFFQTLLLLGYLYVFLICRFSLRIQLLIHSIFVLAVGMSICIFLFANQIIILPVVNPTLQNIQSPIVEVLKILFIAIGIPYFLLSTTSILLQKWFGIIYKQKSPYRLYALSNTASLLALLSYPILFEPYFTLNTQGSIWSVLFLCYATSSLGACIVSFIPLLKMHIPMSKNVSLQTTNKEKVTYKLVGTWIILPAISSLMLFSITNLLTQAVASVPFLWVLPLSLYLLSFILAFSGRRWYWRNFYAYLFLASGLFTLVFTRTDIPSLFLGILIASMALFSACMLCHGEVYDSRPPAEYIDRYYLCIAFGSVLSGIFAGIIAPIFFRGIWEVYIAFYLAFVVSAGILIYKNSLISKHLHVFMNSRKEALIALLLCFPICLLGVSLFTNAESGYSSIKVWRNFYGVLTVTKKRVGNLTGTYLKHGNIIHGAQLSGNYRRTPTTYYGKQSGIGIVLDALRGKKQNIHMGVIGLGTGTLAAYGRKDDLFTFYEINPQVAQIAQNEFTYLSESPARIRIVLGDGRLSLQKELRSKDEQLFDILIVDAFSDDAIPPHLLTKEALALYLKRIVEPDGILAFHISNNFIDLRPVLVAAAKYYNLSYAIIHTPNAGINTEAIWMFLSYDKKFFQKPSIAKIEYPDDKTYKQINLWTDQYSNLFQVLK